MHSRGLLAPLAYALVLVLTAPGVAAQSDPAATDGTGDTTLVVTAAGNPTPVDVPEEYPAASSDLVSLTIVESDETFSWTVTARDLSQDNTFVRWLMPFRWGEMQYQLSVWYGRFNGGENSFAQLQSLTNDGWRTVAELDSTVLSSANSVTTVLPRVYVIDSKNSIPLKGDTLTGISVTSSSNRIRFFGSLAPMETEIRDRMPDTGDVAFGVTRGGVATGHIVLGATQPVRVSNGAATTFVFETLLRNTGGLSDIVNIVAENVPEDWTVTIRSPVRIGPDEDKIIPVLVSLPFRHEHGGFDNFDVVATSVDQPQVYAAVKLGVLHTPIPYPAGHHSEVFLHAESDSFLVFGELFPFAPPYMTTQNDHTNDVPWATPNCCGRGDVAWRIPLNPELGIGLDFRPEELAHVEGEILGNGFQGASTLYAELWLERSIGEPALLAAAEPGPISLSATDPVPFSVDLKVERSADLVPQAPRQNMVLYLRVVPDVQPPCCFGNRLAPHLGTAAFKMYLPLNEYHDPIPSSAEIFGNVDLSPIGVVEKSVPAGSVWQYGFDVKNKGDSADTFLLSLEGNGVEYARILPSDTLRLGAGKGERIAVEIAVPPESLDGQLFQVLLVASAKSDPSKVAIVRTLTTVDNAAAAPRATDLVIHTADGDTKDTPAPGVTAMVVVAGVAMALRARRRNV